MKRLLIPAVFLASAMAAFIYASDADAQIRKRVVTTSKTEVLVQPAPAAAAQVEATAKKVGPVFCAVVRAKLRQEYRKQGMGLIESIRKANAASDDVINGLVADAEAISGVKVVGTAIGDGTLIDKLIEFFNSPAGKALLDALLKLLIGLI